MEHIRKLRMPTLFKVKEFKYPIEKFDHFSNSTSDFSDLSSITLPKTPMMGGYETTEDTLSTTISSYKNFNNYFKEK